MGVEVVEVSRGGEGVYWRVAVFLAASALRNALLSAWNIALRLAACYKRRPRSSSASILSIYSLLCATLRCTSFVFCGTLPTPSKAKIGSTPHRSSSLQRW